MNSSLREGKYDLDFKNPNSDKSKWIDGQELTNLYLEFIKDFPVVSIEDPFDQDHWDAWTNITANTSIQVTLLCNLMGWLKVFG
jgi:enolase